MIKYFFNFLQQFNLIIGQVKFKFCHHHKWQSAINSCKLEPFTYELNVNSATSWASTCRPFEIYSDDQNLTPDQLQLPVSDQQITNRELTNQ